MDPRYTGEMLKHLEKQNELLMDAYRSMSHELHKFQVEEEMLMRKFYEFMSAEGLTKKGCNQVESNPVIGCLRFTQRRIAILEIKLKLND